MFTALGLGFAYEDCFISSLQQVGVEGPFIGYVLYFIKDLNGFLYELYSYYFPGRP